jgi:hypothetical protein
MPSDKLFITKIFIVMKRKEFKLKNEELAALGEFLESSFLRDKDLFAAFSPVYANGFAEEYHNKLVAANTAKNSEVFTGKRMLITENLHNMQDAMILMTFEIKKYCRMAKGRLTFHMNILDLAGFRKCLRSRNTETSLKHARRIQQTLESDLEVLVGMGYTAERQNAFNELIDTLAKYNLQQNDMLNDRKKQVEDRTNLMNELWKMVRDLMETGQIIHRNETARRDEYTGKNLISRVRMMISSKKNQEEQTEPEPAAPEQSIKESPPVAA